MKSLKTVFSLIRLPNLLMIAFSLYLIRFLILYPAYLYTHATFALSDLDFALMVLSIIFIAAGGYLINDIFDIETDQINQRVNHINRFIGTKAATYIYYIFSFIGFILGLILSLRINQLSLAVLFAIVIIVLYYYAINYKNKLYKNLIISLLCGMLILFPVLFEFFALISTPNLFISGHQALNTVLGKIYGLAGFAFCYTFFRELMKDMEDIEGDKAVFRQTIPIKWGIKNAKIIAAGVLALIVILTIVSYVYLYDTNKNIIGYLIICWNIPQLYMAYLLYKSKEKPDFHYISLIAKITMLVGLASLFLFI